ncbi:hypothetical protein VTG60DRAFT_5328 [Thermothelomyces hinnuleus]
MLALAESNPAAAAALNAAQAKPSTPSAAASKSASPAPSAAAAAAAAAVAASSGGGASKRSSAAAAKRAAAKEKQEQEKKKARQTPKPEPQPQPEPQPAADRSPDVEMPDAPPPPTTQAPPGREPAATDTAGGGGPAEEAAAAAQPSTYPRESAILPPYARPPPRPHPGDADPLLVSRVPPFPSDDELRALMTAAPLSYLEARAAWDEDGPGRYPVRVFCAVCGYWGRVKCMKCGTRVCALDCLEAHREECVTRYGL